MGKWLSFIVPVYNAEAYLAECIDSMLRQDMPANKYEIILFDDGSTDRSREIADDYARRHPDTIRVFSHANAGVAETRNAAIKQAQGEYIWFVDSDDKIAENILSTMYRQITHDDLDILSFNIARFNKTNQWKYTNLRETPVGIGIQFYIQHSYNIESVNKIFRKSIFTDHNLSFKLRMAEDAELMPLCCFHANRVKTIDICAYYYRINENSLTHTTTSKDWSEQNLLCLESHIDYMTTHTPHRYWMRVLVNDIRILFWQITTARTDARFHKNMLRRLRADLQKALKHTPKTLNRDLLILSVTAILPHFALSVYQTLKRMQVFISVHSRKA